MRTVEPRDDLRRRAHRIRHPQGPDPDLDGRLAQKAQGMIDPESACHALHGMAAPALPGRRGDPAGLQGGGRAAEGDELAPHAWLSQGPLDVRAMAFRARVGFADDHGVSIVSVEPRPS